ncbi:MAG: hypothetical protein A2404_17805 [Bdellovibrionales bacterium RIFOXYC1_FULL_39_130]|nr:MAG: hypothetical protein A2404_17805 [Bdellovibrionales bacterium RIFOXYC1_FULL_39_130]
MDKIKCAIASLPNLEKSPWSSLEMACPEIAPHFMELLTSSLFPLCYFKSRNGQEEVIAMGSWQELDNCATSELIASFPKLTIIYKTPFSNKSPCSAEWSLFTQHSAYLPIMLFFKQKNNYSLKIQFNDNLSQTNELLEQCCTKIEEALCSTCSQKNIPLLPTSQTQEEIPTLFTWNIIIKKVLQALEDKFLSKVVLARKQLINYDTPLDPLTFLDKVQSKNDHSYLFFYAPKQGHAFISKTPERLFWQNKNILEVDAIAGTRLRGDTPEEDTRLAAELLSSAKELAEHRIVTQTIKKKLELICADIQLTECEQINKLNYVQHIRSQFKGLLLPKIDPVSIINLLHPTPAVGGDPQEIACQYINELEPFERGLYAAPVGIISQNQSEVIVGIRSILIDGQQLHIFGGAGIVAGSTGIAEWKEITAKMNNFLNLL